MARHAHDNVITPRPDPSGRTSGFWDIGTGAHVDWTSQCRVVEPMVRTDGTISIFCTLVDHAAPVDPAGASNLLLRLVDTPRADGQRFPSTGSIRRARERPEDRNVELVLPAPAWLRSS